MMDGRILLLLPVREIIERDITNDEHFEEIVDALKEGSYEKHHASSDSKQTTLVHAVEAGIASDMLGASGFEHPRSIEVVAHDDHVERDAVDEALTCVNSPYRGDKIVRKRMQEALITIATATGDGPDGPLGEGARIINSASPWGPMSIVHYGPLSTTTTIEVPTELASLLPQIVNSDWRVRNDGEILLELKPLSATIWTLEKSPMEIMRSLTELRTSPPIP